MNDVISRLLNADYGELWASLREIIQNPRSDLIAFTLILAVATVILLLIVTSMIAWFMSADDEEDDGESDAEFPASRTELEAPPEPVRRTAPPRNAAQKIASALVWILAWSAVWVAGGIVTRQDAICISCHTDGGIHVARVEGQDDPHGEVQCVSCHENPSFAASVTARVPSRAVHYVAGFLTVSWARPYGVPVPNSSCRSCHHAEVTATFEDADRGVRISHAEPLSARALCTDCHRPGAGTGVVDRYTVGMSTCIRCHNQKTASAECAFCHTRDVSYASRSRGSIRVTRLIKTVDCGSCHSQETCDECHGIRMPHGVDFQGGGHARAAVEDVWFNGGKTCGRCHSATRRPCTACHTGMFPAHGSSWAVGHQAVDPNKNGCGVCHEHLSGVAGRNFCGLCHPQWTGVK